MTNHVHPDSITSTLTHIPIFRQYCFVSLHLLLDLDSLGGEENSVRILLYFQEEMMVQEDPIELEKMMH